MAKMDWDGPHPGEPTKRYYQRRVSGYYYDQQVETGIAALRSYGLTLDKARQDPFNISPTLIVLSGLEPSQLLEELVEVQVVQMPLEKRHRIAGDFSGDKLYTQTH